MGWMVIKGQRSSKSTFGANNRQDSGMVLSVFIKISIFSMAWFQLILPVQCQNVTKNRTDHRMHVEGPQICQINRWNNSFQNMYGMNRQQLTVWPGKSIFEPKNTSLSPTLVDTNLSYLTLEAPGLGDCLESQYASCVKVLPA